MIAPLPPEELAAAKALCDRIERSIIERTPLGPPEYLRAAGHLIDIVAELERIQTLAAAGMSDALTPTEDA